VLRFNLSPSISFFSHHPTSHFFLPRPASPDNFGLCALLLILSHLQRIGVLKADRFLEPRQLLQFTLTKKGGKNTAKMGFVEDELKQLKDVIGNLDSRIKSLEQRATGSVAPVSTEEVRMLLIGPPGAGMLSCVR
jgi:adenylate kinase